MELENVLNKIQVKKYKNAFFKIFSVMQKIFLWVVIILLLGYCAYLWYIFIYNPSWSDNKKQEYINSKSSKNISFDKKRFEEVTSKIEERKTEYKNSIGEVRDIFKSEIKV